MGGTRIIGCKPRKLGALLRDWEGLGNSSQRMDISMERGLLWDRSNTRAGGTTKDAVIQCYKCRASTVQHFPSFPNKYISVLDFRGPTSKTTTSFTCTRKPKFSTIFPARWLLAQKVSMLSSSLQCRNTWFVQPATRLKQIAGVCGIKWSNALSTEIRLSDWQCLLIFWEYIGMEVDPLTLIKAFGTYVHFFSLCLASAYGGEHV